MQAANDNEALPRSRAEARACGSRHFFTGKPCKKYGHVAPRLTSDNHCIECSALRSAERREYMAERWVKIKDNPDRRGHVREYQKTPDRLEYKREYRRKQRLNQEYLDKESEYGRLRRETPEYKEYRRAYEERRRREDPKFRLKQSVSRSISRSISTGKGGRKTFDLLGYTKAELMDHLERQFEPGMSWDNYGDWHIDHIVPLAAHNITSPDDIDFKNAWSLSNLRPLWAIDNLKKGAKLLAQFQPSLSLALPPANDNATTAPPKRRRHD